MPLRECEIELKPYFIINAPITKFPSQFVKHEIISIAFHYTLQPIQIQPIQEHSLPFSQRSGTLEWHSSAVQIQGSGGGLPFAECSPCLRKHPHKAIEQNDSHSPAELPSSMLASLMRGAN